MYNNFVKLYVCYDKGRTDISITDDNDIAYKTIQNKKKENKKENKDVLYFHNRINKIEDIFYLLGSDIDLNNIKFKFSNCYYLNYLQLKNKKIFEQYRELALEKSVKNKLPLYKNSIVSIVYGCEMEDYPVYIMKISEKPLPDLYVNVITDSYFLSMNIKKEILAESHAVLKLIDYAISKKKDLDIILVHGIIMKFIDFNYELKSNIDIGNEFRLQYKYLLDKAIKNNINITFRTIGDFKGDPFITELYKDIKHHEDKLYEEVFDSNKKDKKGNNIGAPLEPLLPTAVQSTRKREFIIDGIQYKNNDFTFNGNYLEIYYEKRKERHHTEEELLMLIVMSPDIQYYINNRLEDLVSTENNELFPYLEIIPDNKYDSTLKCNVDYLTSLVLRKGLFLVTRNIGFTRHYVINITEAIPLISSNNDYCMKILTPLLMTVPRINSFYKTGDAREFSSFHLPVSIRKNSYTTTVEEDKFANQGTASYWYKIKVYSKSGKKVIKELY